MEFNTQYERKYRSKPEVNKGPVIVEKAGYVPTQKRIEELMFAGFRLQMIRKEQYDYVDDVDVHKAKIVPSRIGNYDLVDAQNDIHALAEKRRAYEEAVKASQNAQNASESKANEKVDDNKGGQA